MKASTLSAPFVLAARPTRDRLLTLLAVLVCAGAPSSAHAQRVDFETVPGGAPADQLPVSTQYLADFGITFSLAGGGTPFLEASGSADSGHGFYNADFDTFDIESTSHAGGLGTHFLRFGTATFSPAPGPTLIIDYASPVSAASAEIWDIDAASGGTNGFEAWTVTARDINGLAIETQVSPNGIDETLPSSLNGKPWVWSFDRASNDIHSIAIQFTGTANLVGLAFDNFTPSSPAAVPISPWIAPALAAALGLLGGLRLRSRFAERGSGFDRSI